MPERGRKGEHERPCVCVRVCMRKYQRESARAYFLVRRCEKDRKGEREIGREFDQVLEGHVKHTSAVAPTVDEYLPLGQLLQSAEPTVVLNLPAGHAVHVLPLPSAPSGPV